MIKLKVEFHGMTLAEWHLQVNSLVAGPENNFGTPNDITVFGDGAEFVVRLPDNFTPYTPLGSTIVCDTVALVEDKWADFEKLFYEIENNIYE